MRGMDGHIATYLNDHLAGATAGVEIAQYLIDHFDGDGVDARLSALKTEIEKDDETLRSLMEDLDIDKSGVRQASGWISEKMTELKLYFDDPKEGPLRAFEALELLSLGIEGKRCLWLALASAAEKDVRLDRNYRELITRAEKQRQVVEEFRLAAAQDALASNA